MREKLAPRARESRFIGVPFGTKGFILYDPATKKTIVSRDVVFDERPQLIDYRDITVGDDAASLAPEELEFHPDHVVVNEPVAVPNPVVDHDPVVVSPDSVVVPQDNGSDSRKVVGVSRSGRKLYEPERFYDANFVDLDSMVFLAATDPTSYNEAVSVPEKEKWITAMKEELDSLKKNGTYVETKLPNGRKAIGCRWIYKTKLKSDGTIDKYKARLVAQGYSQIPGQDYSETFAPVARLTTLRTLLALISCKEMIADHVDVKSAYLQADLAEEVYMKPPPGSDVPDDYVCLLKKGLYGLKQSGKNWHDELTSFISPAGFVRSQADPCLFVNPKSKTYVLIYVDDLIVCSTDADSVTKFKCHLGSKFEISDLGKLHWYLGLSITTTSEGLKLSQDLYVDTLLKKFGLTNAKVFRSPAAELRLCAATCDDVIRTNVPYRELVGSLMWLSVCTRPDISYSVNSVAKYVESPTDLHWNAAKRILRYVKGTPHAGLLFRKGGDIILNGYSDSDWAGDETRKSTTGYVFMINGCAVSWSSRLQKPRAMSSAEAEYMAGCEASLEAVYLRRLLTDLGFPQNEPTVIYQDSQPAIKMEKNPALHKLSKHIDLRYHSVRDHINLGVVTMKWVSTNEMLADVLTKPLGPIKHSLNSKKLLVDC